MSYPRVCVPRILTDEQRAEAVTVAIQENEKNRQEVKHEDGRTLAVEVNKRWQNGRIIRCRFLNGDEVQKMKCEREAHKWEAYANIKFVFDNARDAEIRIAFFDGGRFNDRGSWSYIGTDCLIAPKDQQTVNLGWLDKNTPDPEWERVTMHEFGHALGADHEDQQPAQKIKWNKEVVYGYFTGPPNNWTRQMVDENVLVPNGEDGVAHTDFDPDSIMAYFIPSQFTLDGVGVAGGQTLSDKDKVFIGTMYPVGQTPVAVVTTLVPGHPAINSRVDIANPTNTYSLPITQEGVYRVWTSFVGGVVYVGGPTGRQVSSGMQQTSFQAMPGQYTVIVSYQPPVRNVQYRIVVRKIR